MKAVGEFIFKSAIHKDGGSFTNQSGQEIKFGESYQVKFDEVLENGEINERKIKVATTETALVQKLLQMKPYKKCKISFDVGFNASGVTLKMADIEQISKAE